MPLPRDLVVHVHGQFHSRGIYQSHGRNEVIKALLHDEESLGLVSSATPDHSCVSHPREAECGSGPAIKVNCGLSRLDAGSNTINSLWGPLQVDLFASRITKQLPRFFSWKPDPLAEAVDAFKQTWIEFTGYANPPWGLIGHCVQYTLQQDATIVLITPLWPGQPWYPTLFPVLLENPRLLPLSPDLLTSPQGLKFSFSRKSQSVGRMVHLRQSYQGAGISDEATTLLLASWRSSTTENYNSSWRVWEQWYVQSSTNPISPTLSDILAYQFHQGKQYRSLNCYRSALSSVLAPIDGFDIGCHPLVCTMYM